MKSITAIIALLVATAGLALAHDRGAVRLNKPYSWELKAGQSHQPLEKLFTTQSLSWTTMGPAPVNSSYSPYSNHYSSVSGRITSIAVDPANSDIVYAAAAGGGLWNSTDGGSSWSPLTDNFPRLSSGSVAMDPSNPSTIYYCTGELNFNIDGYPGTGIIYKSTDGGASWMQEQPPAGGGLYYSSKIVVAPSNTNVIYAAGYYDAYKSADGGQTWTELNLTDGAVDDIVVDPQNANIIYASYGSGFSGDSTNYGIYESTDGGSTWTWLTNGLPPPSEMFRISLAIAPSNSQVLYAAINGNKPASSSADTNRVYKSVDGGQSWSVLPSVSDSVNFGGNQGWYNNVIAVDPTNPDTVYVGGIDFWKSTDGGQTWTNLTNGYGPSTGKNVHVDQHAIAFAGGSGSTFYIGNDGGVWKTTDGGTSFKNCNSDLQTIQFYDISADQNNSEMAIGGTQDNGTEMNTQPSLIWNEVYGGDGGYVLMDPKNPNVVYTEYVNGALMKSTNGGGDWTQIFTKTGYWLTPYVMDPMNDNVLYTATSKIYKTTNAGGNWTAISSDLVSSSDLVTTMSISPVEDSVLYAGISGYRGGNTPTSDHLFVSRDGGTTWTDITSNLPDSTDFCQVTADPTRKGVAYLAVLVGAGVTSSPHVLRTTDYGVSWTGLGSTTSGFPPVPTKVVRVDSLTGDLYAGTYEGVYRSTDNGATWVEFGTGLPNAVVDGMAIRYSTHTLLVGTHGRGAWQINELTGVALPAEVPATFAVNQNYPNPFNPTTVISYRVPAAGLVTLRVYDILGREVATLVNARQSPGMHLVTFNAGGLASGVYFYQLKAGNLVETKKMELLK